jgi:hypothetical protein
MEHWRLNMKQHTLWKTFIAATLWINLSEVARYFLVVKPMIQAELSMVPNVAAMDVPIFLIWGIWDTLLTCLLMWMVWLCAPHFKSQSKLILIAGTSMWLSFFALFWLGMINMNLSSVKLASIALPWAWLEMIIGAWITHWGYKRFA